MPKSKRPTSSRKPAVQLSSQDVDTASTTSTTKPTARQPASDSSAPKKVKEVPSTHHAERTLPRAIPSATAVVREAATTDASEAPDNDHFQCDFCGKRRGMGHRQCLCGECHKIKPGEPPSRQWCNDCQRCHRIGKSGCVNQAKVTTAQQEERSKGKRKAEFDETPDVQSGLQVKKSRKSFEVDERTDIIVID